MRKSQALNLIRRVEQEIGDIVRGEGAGIPVTRRKEKLGQIVEGDVADEALHPLSDRTIGDRAEELIVVLQKHS